MGARALILNGYRAERRVPRDHRLVEPFAGNILQVRPPAVLTAFHLEPPQEPSGGFFFVRLRESVTLKQAFR
jgi:hypothetical protein